MITMKNQPAGYLSDSLIMFAAAAGIMFMRFMLGSGDVCHPESCAFLQIYTEPGKSLLQIIFNPWYTDWNCYQARELSYLLDWCDVQIIKASILAGHAHFFSVVSALMLIAAAMVLHFGFRRWMPKLGRWGAMLLALLFVAAPACNSVGFFRSSKPAVTLGIAIAGIALWSIIRRRRETISTQWGAWISLESAVFLMPYFDRQGMFFVSAFTMACAAFIIFLSLKPISVFFAIAESDRSRLTALMITGMTSTALATFYNLVIGPYLIFYLNGYHPSFNYQNMGYFNSVRSIFHLLSGSIYLLDNTGFTVSGCTGPAAIAIGAFVFLLWLLLCCKYAKSHPAGWLLLITVAGVMTALLVIANIMTTRHPPILLPDVIHSGYFLPSLVTLILLLAVSIEVMGGENIVRLQTVTVILTAVMIGIHLFSFVFSKQEDRGHLDHYAASSPELIRCLNDPARDPEKARIPYSYLQLIRYYRLMQR